MLFVLKLCTSIIYIACALLCFYLSKLKEDVNKSEKTESCYSINAKIIITNIKVAYKFNKVHLNSLF